MTPRQPGRIRLVLLAVAAVAAAAAIAPEGRPPAALAQPAKPFEIAVAAADLARQLRVFAEEMPDVDVDPTPAHFTLGVQGCAVYQAAAKRLPELGEEFRGPLARLGIRAGWCGGHPEIMLEGAKARLAAAGGKPEDYAASTVFWAGIYAGNPAAAKAGLQYLIDHSTHPELVGWAKTMVPLADGCGKVIDLAFTGVDGKAMKLADFRGKVVVLHFWATKSEACTAEAPGIRQFYAQRKGDPNFAMLGLSLDLTADRTQRSAGQLGLSWPQAMAEGAREKFGIKEIPDVVVISPRGHTLWQGHPGVRVSLQRTVDFARRQAAREAGQTLVATQPATLPAAAAITTTPEKLPDVRITLPGTAPATPAPAPAANADDAAKAESLYKLGVAYIKAGQRERGVALLQDVMIKYPATPAAQKARGDLNALGR